MLGEVAELALMVARELAVRTRESEDVEQTVALADAFQKVSRVVRLTLALDFKLDRDAARDVRDAAREAAKADADAATQRRLAALGLLAPGAAQGPVEARKTRVSNLVNRLLWNECEGDSEDYEVLFDDLSARLDEAALSDDFETLPIETLARRGIADMGLSGELTLSLSETPPGDAPPQPPELADTG
jgi:D-serine deaminase-like pyridoxal phosphate-dependent protein